jgi:hypothetical protein
MGVGRVGKKRLPTDMRVMLRIGKAKTSTKITFVAVLRLKPPNRRRPRSMIRPPNRHGGNVEDRKSENLNENNACCGVAVETPQSATPPFHDQAATINNDIGAT